MTKRQILMVLFGAMSLFMIIVTVQTSMQSSLFADWPRLAREPWMAATLKDFYNNILLLFVWVAYKERSVFMRLVWLVAFVLLGSIATSFYVFIQLWKLPADEPVENILFRNRPGVSA